MLAALTVAALALAVCWAPSIADAQCAMCKTGVAAGGEQAARTMRAGMLVLLIPPVAIFCTIFAVFVRHRNGRDGEGDSEKHGGR